MARAVSAAFDVAIVGADVVDGTGGPRRRADVGIAGGRIVEIGDLSGAATRTIEAAGRIVTPGFVDVHTHLDVQGFWDSTLSPSPLHGVTTVFGGNCGYSVAPLDASSADYVMRMLSRVEAMPVETLEQGVPWSWSSTAEYFALLDNTLAVNAGFLVGHSPLRRIVMGPDAVRREATADEIARMADILRVGLAAGALGFSTSRGLAHRDADGAPVPSMHAAPEEFLALAKVCGEFEGTSLEFIPPTFTSRNENARLSDETIELMADMSAIARRPLNWNVLAPNAENIDACVYNLKAYDVARAKGGHVVALTSPQSGLLRMSFASGALLDVLVGWSEAMLLPPDEKLALLSDPAARKRLEESAAQPGPARQFVSRDWGEHVIFDTHSPETKRWEGMRVRDIAAQLGKSDFDALVDIVCADKLRTGFGRPGSAGTDDDRAARQRIWTDGRAIVGGSDAGAHLDMIETFSMTTSFLRTAVREYGLLSLEEAIRQLTSAPAALYGLRDRGVLTPGAYADLVVLDESTIGPGPLEMRYDLPGGAGRLYAGAEGIDQVLVNGQVIVEQGGFTDARPGKLLRSGVDTSTSVTIRESTCSG